MSMEKIPNVAQLADRVKLQPPEIRRWFDELDFKKRNRGTNNIDHTIIRATYGMKDNERKKLIKLAEKKGKYKK
jgi:hypothetical protein